MGSKEMATKTYKSHKTLKLVRLCGKIGCPQSAQGLFSLKTAIGRWGGRFHRVQPLGKEWVGAAESPWNTLTETVRVFQGGVEPRGCCGIGPSGKFGSGQLPNLGSTIVVNDKCESLGCATKKLVGLISGGDFS